MVGADANLENQTKIFIFTRDYQRSKDFIDNHPKIVAGIVENF